MAKDGTNRGGRRVRAGDKPLSAVEKIQKGQALKILNNDLPNFTPTSIAATNFPEGAELEGVDMPRLSEYLSAQQKNGVPLGADDIFKETWLWLKERGCERLVNPRLSDTSFYHLHNRLNFICTCSYHVVYCASRNIYT